MVENRIAKFEKVSFEQYKKDYYDAFPECMDINNEEDLKVMYDMIELPKRATKGSAGYDFYAPFSFTMIPGETIKIPTGIRCKMENGWVLKCYPRSGLGFKYQLNLANEVGIIDEDFYYSSNEGHIQIKLVNRGSETFSVKKGKGFSQGVFVPFGITVDDECEGMRDGGFGSTDK